MNTNFNVTIIETRTIIPNSLNYNAPLCMGRSKGKAGIHLKYYPENRDTFEIYPGKVMHMIGG